MPAEHLDAEPLLLSLAAVVVLGVGAQWLAWRVRLPSILLLLAFGFLAGPIAESINPSGAWRINPDKMLGRPLLTSLVSLSVALILFEGGLTLRIKELRDIGSTIGRLVTFGPLVTWLLSAAAAKFLLGFNDPMALILGAILVVTGPTVVGPLLRFIRPAGRVGAIAKWEGIVIDPIGAMLAVLTFAAMVHAEGLRQITNLASLGLLKTVLVGGLVGLLGALPTILMLRRYWIPDFLQSPVLFTLVIACFTAANRMQEESGLLAVTLMGVVLANQKIVPVKHIIQFKENLRVLLISWLFILLAARLDSSEFMGMFTWRNAGFLAVLMLVVRPLAVWVSTVKSGLTWQERLFLSWMAPRGIVAAALASVFVLRPGAAGIGVDQHLVSATFFVIVGTVAIYGLTAAPLARWLELATPNPQGLLIAGAHRAARQLAQALQEAGFKVLLVDSNWANVKTARLEGLASHYASILSDHVPDELDLGGVGRFLAMTPNDEVNSLAALHFSEIFGRAEVYQLPPETDGSRRTETASHHLRGRQLFAPEVIHGFIDRRMDEGAVIKKTSLTEQFDYEAYQSLYGTQALVLFVINPRGLLKVNTLDAPARPSPGDTVISLVDPDEG